MNIDVGTVIAIILSLITIFVVMYLAGMFNGKGE